MERPVFRPEFKLPEILRPPTREAPQGLPKEIFYTPEQNKLADNLLKAFPDPKNLELAVRDNIDPEIGRTTSMSVDQLPSEVKAQISHINPETNQIVLKNGDEMAIPHGLMATPDGGLRRSTLADAPPPSAAHTATSFAASNAHAAAAPGKTITVGPEFTPKAKPPTPAEQAATQAAEATAQRTAAAATAAKNAATQSQTTLQSNKPAATEAKSEESASTQQVKTEIPEQATVIHAPIAANIAAAKSTVDEAAKKVAETVAQAAALTNNASTVSAKQAGQGAQDDSKQRNQQDQIIANAKGNSAEQRVQSTGKAGTHKNSG